MRYSRGLGAQQKVAVTLRVPHHEQNTIDSADPIVHADNIHRLLQDLITHMRRYMDQMGEPRFQALLETSAEVLIGLQTAFLHYREGTEKAWKR